LSAGRESCLYASTISSAISATEEYRSNSALLGRSTPNSPDPNKGFDKKKRKKNSRELIVGAHQIRGFPKGGAALVEGLRRRFDPNPFSSPAGSGLWCPI